MARADTHTPMRRTAGNKMQSTPKPMTAAPTAHCTMHSVPIMPIMEATTSSASCIRVKNTGLSPEKMSKPFSAPPLNLVPTETSGASNPSTAVRPMPITSMPQIIPRTVIFIAHTPSPVF